MMEQSKIEYKIPQAKELKIGMHDAHELSNFLDKLQEKYNLSFNDEVEIKQWQKILEPKPIS